MKIMVDTIESLSKLYQHFYSPCVLSYEYSSNTIDHLGNRSRVKLNSQAHEREVQRTLRRLVLGDFINLGRITLVLLISKH